MTSLEDVADSGPDVTLAADVIESHYELKTTDVTTADELSPEGEFPQYGRFVLCDEFSPVDGSDRGETYVEVPRALAGWLVENVDIGDRWRVADIEKVDGEWHVDGEIVKTGDQSSIEAAAAMDGSAPNEE